MEVVVMQKQAASIFVTNKQQQTNTNQTEYSTEKKITITRTETSDSAESNQTIYCKRK